MELLNDMAIFVEVAKVRSFRHAAKAIGMPNSTVSRRITALEKAIGLRLLHRTTRKIELTQAGQLYYERCKRIVDEARIAHEQLGEMLEQPSGVLRASLPVDFANIYLAPLIAEFAGRYPGIHFEFDLTPRRVDLVSEPMLSETTMRTHHDKHHAKYVSTINELLAKSGAKPGSLEELVRAAKAAGDSKLYNNAGQAWNHAFFRSCMAAGQTRPSGLLADALRHAFGDLEGAKTRFVADGVAHFGSGWVWLIARAGKVQVATTHDGMTALELDGVPLLVCDLWEHAYYLDHKNDREGFLKAWWDKAINWDFVSRQFAGERWAYPAPGAI